MKGIGIGGIVIVSDIPAVKGQSAMYKRWLLHIRVGKGATDKPEENRIQRGQSNKRINQVSDLVFHSCYNVLL